MRRSQPEPGDEGQNKGSSWGHMRTYLPNREIGRKPVRTMETSEQSRRVAICRTYLPNVGITDAEGVRCMHLLGANYIFLMLKRSQTIKLRINHFAINIACKVQVWDQGTT